MEIIKTGWENISKSEKKLIAICLDKIKDPKENRQEALTILFNMFNMYLGGNYGDAAKTCGTCVRTVVKAFTQKIENDGK
tara:strand:- start:575 stop:814 length:240 start_codon:yes stop_codon:yes gene_type:complete